MVVWHFPATFKLGVAGAISDLLTLKHVLHKESFKFRFYLRQVFIYCFKKKVNFLILHVFREDCG